MSEADPDLRDPARQAYYADARSWAEDAGAARDRSRRLAWGIAAAAAAIAVLEALALVALAPLKTVVPYTLLVDRNTGFVEALDPAHVPAITPQAALTQSLLAQYVVARESFDIAGLPEQYRKVALWSADAARRDYLALMARGNPEGPIGRYPRDTQVQTHIESVSALGADAALVRFYTERRDAGQGAGPRAYWVAVVHFRFSGEPMALADRLVDPLGFQVVEYRRDQESPPPPEPAAIAAPAAIGPATIAPASAPPSGPSPAVPAAMPRGGAVPAWAPPAGRARPGVIQTLRR